jgi:pimeloyl-ACP methyl ester carboxylesterase
MDAPKPHRTPHLRASDLRGAGRLAVDATLGLTNLVENLHHNILRVPGPLGTASERPAGGITGLVYRSIRGVTRLVGGSVDALLGQLVALLGSAEHPASAEREAVLAALNGVLGDHLDASANPLAITMQLRHHGHALVLDRAGLAQAVPQPRRRVLLMLHGLCMNAQQWCCQGHDHGALLAAEGGYTALYLNYNSGRHIADNGRLLADQLQALADAWPVPLDELVMLGHSMGGLVARSACHQAMQRGDRWPQRLTKMVFLGSPHQGAPLERGGHWIDLILGASPYTAAFARLSTLRSAGITDLRHGSLLATDPQAHVPLPTGVACYAIAGSLGSKAGALREALLGDGLVPVASALGRHRLKSRRLAFAPDQQWIGQGIGHLDLLARAKVMEPLRRWLVAGA